MARTPKTVYILGAGFSAPAGGPNQDAIMSLLVKRPESDRLQGFLQDYLKIPKAKIKNLALEDVYTPIDRCIADRQSFRGIDQQRLERIRFDLDMLIARVIKDKFDAGRRSKKFDDEYVTVFSKYLVSQARHRSDLARGVQNADCAKSYDPFSIISLNWDILLDNALDRALEKADAEVGFNDYDPFGVVDYCCYVSSLDKGDRRIRTGLWSLGAKGYNVKLLKIHGSMNWLQCTNCQQLFTKFGEKLITGRSWKCRHCAEHEIEAPLRGSLIMPTFLKNFSNFQLKLVWQNAAVELMEATRLVFIGYSLPESDFEFRQLLSRMVHPKAKIEAVLWKNEDNPLPYELEQDRYRQFFAGHKVSFESKGVEAFVQKEVSDSRK